MTEPQQRLWGRHGEAHVAGRWMEASLEAEKREQLKAGMRPGQVGQHVGKTR